jgi:uncharacterized membrane protein (DUF106 family)
MSPCCCFRAKVKARASARKRTRELRERERKSSAKNIKEQRKDLFRFHSSLSSPYLLLFRAVSIVVTVFFASLKRAWVGAEESGRERLYFFSYQLFFVVTLLLSMKSSNPKTKKTRASVFFLIIPSEFNLRVTRIEKYY